MWIKTQCRLELDYLYETPLLLMLRPRSGAGQWVAAESYSFSDQIEATQYTDDYGNLCQRLTAPADGFVIETAATVRTAPAMDEGAGEPFVDINALPEEGLRFLAPSRYCESDRMGGLAMEAADLAQPGYNQVANIVDWIRERVIYAPGTSGVPLSASEILAQGEGVCKDLTHLGIGLCRSISIPARYVFGFLQGLEPMDLHAWFEAYVGDRWYVFDPTQNNLEGARVAIAYGRDAADVAIYHQFGPPARFTDMQVAVEEIPPPVLE